MDRYNVMTYIIYVYTVRERERDTKRERQIRIAFSIRGFTHGETIVEV